MTAAERSPAGEPIVQMAGGGRAGPSGGVSAPRTWVRWQIFAILWILVLLNFIDRATLSIALPMISAEFSLTPEVRGVILGSFFWTYLIFQIPGGWLLDKLGPRTVVGGAGVAWGIFQLLGGFVNGAALLTVTRLGLGASEAPVFPTGAKLNSNWLPAKERARGATFIDAAGPFGSAVGGLIVTAIIAVTGGWRWAFIITGGITIVVAALYWLYLRDRPDQHHGVNAAELAHIESDEAAVAARDESGVQSWAAALGRIATLPQVWLKIAGICPASGGRWTPTARSSSGRPRPSARTGSCSPAISPSIGSPAATRTSWADSSTSHRPGRPTSSGRRSPRRPFDAIGSIPRSSSVRRHRRTHDPPARHEPRRPTPAPQIQATGTLTEAPADGHLGQLMAVRQVSSLGDLILTGCPGRIRSVCRTG